MAAGSPTGDARATILVVEDRPEVLDVLRRTLTTHGYRVVTASDGDAGLHIALDATPDLVILDVGLPKRNGFDVAKDLRQRAFRRPILMLTALGGVTDRVIGLEAGADDYLAKPFDYEELLARVKALLRRASIQADDATIRVGDLALDTVARRVTRDGVEVSLTAKEYALLEYLMRNAGRVLTREQISDTVWRQPFDPSSNIVDVYISYVRHKIEGAGTRPLLHTVRGAGYVVSLNPP